MILPMILYGGLRHLPCHNTTSLLMPAFDNVDDDKSINFTWSLLSNTRNGCYGFHSSCQCNIVYVYLYPTTLECDPQNSLVVIRRGLNGKDFYRPKTVTSSLLSIFTPL